MFYETYVGNYDLPEQVGEGEFLLLGDNREEAKDSREYGLIKKDSIKGKVFTIMRRRPL